MKFFNKTFHARKNERIDRSESIEEMIKIQICMVYDFILDMKQEYLLRNSVEYLVGETVHNMEEQIKNNTIENSLLRILPYLNYEAGSQSYEPSRWTYYQTNKHPVFRSLDVIIERSFLEISLICLYFADTPNLQNHLINVNHRMIIRLFRSTPHRERT